MTLVKNIIYKPKRKAMAVMKNAHLAKFRVLDGAVRSAKSFTANDLAIRELQQLPACDVLISGYSITSVARNIVAEWKKIIDPFNVGLFKTVREDKNEYLKINWRGLRNKKFYIRGANKEVDWKQIQGATFGYWYADEWTRHHKTFTAMAISRLSLPFSLATLTTNPDSPFHYVKTNYLDKPDLFKQSKSGRALMMRWTFFLEDNPSLSPSYIRSLKRLYTGVFYKRFILSQWTAAEGVIFDFFDEKPPMVLDRIHLPIATSYDLAIDYGTSNATSIGLFGRNPLTTPEIWLDSEYYYDSAIEGRQKTDGEYVDDLAQFVKKLKINNCIVDPSALSFKTEIKKRAFKFILMDADNSVLDGIRLHQTMLKNGRFALCSDCLQSIKDYYAYCWDGRAQERGEDKPLKTNDHTQDRTRYILQTLYGENNNFMDYTKLNIF